MSTTRASIFCDGACRGNGTRQAVAGWAWAFWPGAARGEPAVSGSARLAPPATNQRAELVALLEALRWIHGGGGGGAPITIYTDSQYTIKCTTVWGPGWKRKGWTRGSGEPLQNLDIIKPLVDLWAVLRVPLVHVRGHQTGTSPEAWGNNWVDRAAVVAAGGDDCGGHASGGVAFFTDAALSATADAIEHLVDARYRPSSGSVSTSSSVGTTPIASPATVPVFAVKKTTKTPTTASVKQMDIRNWFGGGR